MIRKNNILILMIICLMSCNLDQTYHNREEDRKDAEQITSKFYSLLKDNKREDLYKLFSNKFFEVTKKETLNQMLQYSIQQGGNISNFNLTNWQTLVVSGDNPIADYSMIYYVNRLHINTQEIFFLQKENDSIKIVGYKINLDIK